MLLGRLMRFASSLLTAFVCVSLTIGLMASSYPLLADEPLGNVGPDNNHPYCYCLADEGDCSGNGSACRGSQIPGCPLSDWCDNVFNCQCWTTDGECGCVATP